MKWLPTLFAAEAIPSAMITFVALLMFLQLGLGWGMSTLYCALLTLPWVMKSWVRRPLQRWGHYAAQLRCAEVASLLCLVTLAFVFTARTNRREWVLLCLFVLCVLSAWHELVSQMFYQQRLRRPLQRFYRVARMSFTQAAVILTYGVMIVAVGSFEVLFRNYPHVFARSWSLAVYLLAGVYLLLLLWNMWAVRGREEMRDERLEIRDCQAQPSLLPPPSSFISHLSSLFFLLLPQALLFHARVLYLFASPSEGGLGCSLQDIGLAQGTVGVIAFSVGLILGHRLMTKMRGERKEMREGLMIFAIGFSPVVYWLMTQFPPSNLLWLCTATATAQLCFGFGLNACAPILRRLFDDRYADTVNYLYVPLIALVMLPAMAASGWLVTLWGFEQFFAIDALLALPAWLLAYISMRRIVRLPQKE